jgi:hypothetical protein
MPTAPYRLLTSLVAAASLAFALAGPVSASGNSLTVTAANTGAADKVTMAFTGAVPTFTITADSNPPVGIGSGREMPIGDSTFYVHLDCPMSCWSGQITNSVPFERLPQVRGALTQNFEGELRVDIGLAHQTSWSATTQGSSVIVTAPH